MVPGAGYAGATILVEVMSRGDVSGHLDDRSSERADREPAPAWRRSSHR
jgi:hypothetical protein